MRASWWRATFIYGICIVLIYQCPFCSQINSLIAFLVDKRIQPVCCRVSTLELRTCLSFVCSPIWSCFHNQRSKVPTQHREVRAKRGLGAVLGVYMGVWVQRGRVPASGVGFSLSILESLIMFLVHWTYLGVQGLSHTVGSGRMLTNKCLDLRIGLWGRC